MPRTSSDIVSTVEISGFLVSDRADEVLVTYSLGSCIGVTIYDPELKIGGLIHCLLPLSKDHPEKAAERPATYVDTGIVVLLNELFARGAVRERLIVKVAGGANTMDANNRFKIGKRNVTVLKKILWKNELMIAEEDTGGSEPRTMRLYLESGRTTLSFRGEEKEL